MFCSRCGSEVADEAAVCIKCGATVSELDIPSATHPAVGATSSDVAASPPKARLAYIFLGVSLGFLGIHNFYAGYSGRGIAKLSISVLTGWLILPLVAVGIWTIVELCTVDRDVHGVVFT